MNIAIISQFVFPIGYSGTNRLVSLSRGLLSVGSNVKVYIFRPYFYKEEAVNKSPKGEFCGVKYEYPIGRTYRLNTKISKLWDVNWGVITTLHRLYQDNKKQKIDSIIITNDWPIKLFVFSLFSRLLRVPNRVFIVDEYPNKLRKGYDKIGIIDSFIFKLSFLFINKAIFMTDNIQLFYKKYFPAKDKISILKVPITVEADRFQNQAPISKSNNITYIGNFEILKDGLDVLVESFSKVLVNFPDLRLRLAGNAIKEDFDKIKQLVVDLNISSNVDFLGEIHRDKVPEYLFDSKILVMSRPYSKRAEGGFPSKLGEYMLTGIPVLVTDVGEISILLKNNENIFISAPSSSIDFHNKMEFILNNYEFSKKVANKGKKLALRVFNNKYQANRIYNFLS